MQCIRLLKYKSRHFVVLHTFHREYHCRMIDEPGLRYQLFSAHR